MLRRGASEMHPQVGHAVMERRRFTAILVILLEHRPLIDVVVLERDEFALGCGAQPHALLRVRAMTGRLERHLAAEHELDRLA